MILVSNMFMSFSEADLIIWLLLLLVFLLLLPFIPFYISKKLIEAYQITFVSKLKERKSYKFFLVSVYFVYVWLEVVIIAGIVSN